MTTQALDFDWDRFGGTFIDAIGDTLLMVIVTMIVGGFLGLIIGVLLYSTRDQGVLRNKFVYTVLNLLVNFIRPIPFIILIAAIGPLTLKVIGTTVGTNAVMFVMSIAATFGVARIVEQNLVSIDPGVVEAARAMGASPLKIITSVIIPEALGPLILGYTFLFIAVVDMSAMAGIIGGGGLGDFAITYGYQSFNWSVTLVATLAIIVIVQIAQLLGNWLSRKVMRR
ncbi:ABC transporter permease [Corynebacterium sp. CCM 8835]|uniref:ABC transporter permease n=1 Tax=Corynebacterium antarcticum TaxID=2800405 RepID=A0A9Q4CCA5_9CORY|nr:methionine ABC transporter permease [Corynebacterium antarcticum]MCK7642287.1 ABC transporter permease [Corynebacterium antarcticum]MCK7661029.1 ABC transporter permease [Corynebacterium antarcticum]MCL0245776.1 ABC transporter permease [Corynebacterium antarcticum]MCX7491768.1 ABC transporter permease [Corynebacterium antarcticum]MCX7538184.1 ABC transporter permease [Corynebacterium antarcticum]